MPLRTAGYLKARSWANEPIGPRYPNGTYCGARKDN